MAHRSRCASSSPAGGATLRNSAIAYRDAPAANTYRRHRPQTGNSYALLARSAYPHTQEESRHERVRSNRPPRDPSGSPRRGPEARPDRHDQDRAGAPTTGQATAVGRSGDESGDRTLRRSGGATLGIGRASCGREPPSGRSHIRRRGVQRPVWTGRRGSIWHRRHRFQVELHHDDISGSEDNRRRHILHEIQEGDDPDFGSGQSIQRPSRRPRPSCKRLAVADPRLPRLPQ